MELSRFSACRHALTIAALSLLASSVSAHHPILGKFDETQTLTLRGTVTYVDWRNPHAHVFINVDNAGAILNWAVELESPVELRMSGWNADTLQPGDAIVVDGMRARDGSRQVWGESVRRADSGQHVLQVTAATPQMPLAARPAPRWPDGRPALGATPGSAGGYWSYPSATALMENGAEVAMSVDGLLDDIDDASRVAPLQPWALGVYKHRQSRQLRDDPMFLHCKPPGGPRQYQSNLGVQLIEDHEGQRVFVLIGSGNRNYRILFLDGRDQLGQVGGDDDNPLYYGRSVGHWEDDTLVVDTLGFNEDFWFTNGGLPHTNQLRMTERFSRSDFDTLNYDVTIDDPGAYTRPWNASWTLTWVGGEELPTHFCQNNRP